MVEEPMRDKIKKIIKEHWLDNMHPARTADAILKTIIEELPEEKALTSDSMRDIDCLKSNGDCFEYGYNQYRKELLEKLK
jgi:hypothetical protein